MNRGSDTRSRRIDAVIFDMGGVITIPVYPILGDYAREVGLDPRVLADRLRHGAPSIERAERGEISLTEYFELVCNDIHADTGLTLEPRRLLQCLCESTTPAEGGLDLVRDVGRRHRTAILTNNSQELTAVWRSNLPPDLVDLVVDSSVVGMRKPEPEIYQLTLDRLGSAPDRTVFIDDQEANLVPARKLGMESILFEHVGQCRRALSALGVEMPRESWGGVSMRGES